MANIGAAFSGVYPVTGGFSRSVVNDEAGALATLESLHKELTDAGVTFHLAAVKGPVMDRLKAIGFIQQFGGDNHPRGDAGHRLYLTFFFRKRPPRFYGVLPLNTSPGHRLHPTLNGKHLITAPPVQSVPHSHKIQG